MISSRESPALVALSTPLSTALVPASMASTARLVSSWMVLIICAISFVAWVVRFGKLANFVSYYGESASLFTCSCRFDGCIECQQLVLIGDVVDHSDDPTNLVGRLP